MYVCFFFLFYNQKVQQTSQTTPQLLQLLLQQQQQQMQQQQQLQQQQLPQLQPKPQLPTPQQQQYPAAQPVSSQNTLLQQLLQQLGVLPKQTATSATPQQKQVTVPEEQLSPQQQVPSPGSTTSLSSTPGSPHQPSSPMSPVHSHLQVASPQTQQVSDFNIYDLLSYMYIYLQVVDMKNKCIIVIFHCIVSIH